MHVDASVAFACDGAGHIVANSQARVPATFGLSKCAQRIGGLARLADREEESFL